MNFSRILLIFNLFAGIAQSQNISLAEFTADCSSAYKLQIDPNLKLLKIFPPPAELSCREKIMLLSQSTPVRIIWGKDYLNVHLPIFLKPQEPQRFVAVIITPKEQQLLNKLERNSWFLRSRLYWQIKGNFIEIQLNCKKEFSLRQFYQDFHEFIDWILPEKGRLELAVKEKDWLDLQKDLMLDDFRGIQPAYQKKQ